MLSCAAIRANFLFKAKLRTPGNSELGAEVQIIDRGILPVFRKNIFLLFINTLTKHLSHCPIGTFCGAISFGVFLPKSAGEQYIPVTYNRLWCLVVHPARLSQWIQQAKRFLIVWFAPPASRTCFTKGCSVTNHFTPPDMIFKATALYIGFGNA
ncbi:hypothetical protein E4T56_gene5996 [Termitomyces sp. T112]|nr:hypothetical protein E4T56_gene5996 [Termitomyces sp. T112]